MRKIIDSHLDLAWNALSWNRDLTEPIRLIREREANLTDDPARGNATTNLPEMRRGRVALCFGTVLARAKRNIDAWRRVDLDHGTQEIAHAAARGQLAYYRLLERRGEIRVIGSVGSLDRLWGEWDDSAPEKNPVGVLLSMEGADPIVTIHQVEEWWDEGLRIVGLAHYGPSAYAVGTGAEGPVTSEGRELLRAMEERGMILDLTHLSAPGFYEALEQFGGAVVATHNNCQELVPGDRQFSNEQIQMLLDRGAVIGCALDNWMLLPGWERGKSSREGVGLEAVADHIDHICQVAGHCRQVGIGSDLDGGFGTEQSPDGLETIADLQKLEEILRSRGYGEGDIDSIFHGNWLRFLQKNLPA